ncbi:MAG: glycosyltransferase [Candidatus Babeliales bacterium]
MRVALVTNNYFPYKGGVARSVHMLYQTVQRQGYDARIITFPFISVADETHHIIRVYSPLRFFYKTQIGVMPFLLYRQLDAIFNQLKPHIIHIHHPFLLGYAALQWGQQHNVPVVFTYHTQYDQYLYHAPMAGSLCLYLLQQRLATVFSAIHALIVPSQSIAQQLEPLLALQKTSVTVIPTPVELDFFYMTRAPIVHSTLRKPLALLSVSRLVPEKNIPFLLDALCYVRDLPVTLTIAGYGFYYDYLKHYAYQQCKLNQAQVCFVQSPSRDTVYRLYQMTDLFVFASYTETQAIVLAEALASGVPVIAKRAPGAIDYIAHGHTGYLIDTPEQMGQQIRMLFFNRIQLQQLSTQAKQASIRLFDHSSFSRSIISLYAGLK